MNAERTPATPSARQNGVPERLTAFSTRDCERFGLLVKFKIPCPPGLRPVRNDDQAVGVIAGIVDRSGPKAPSEESRAIVGSFPWDSRSLTSS
jgi:hypothetical protein